MQTGDIDRSQLSAAFGKHLTAQMVVGMKQGLAALGDPTSFVYRGKSKASGATAYQYSVGFKGAHLDFTIAVDGDGKISALGIGGE